MTLIDALNTNGRFQLGETSERLVLATRAENRAASVALVRQARHSLLIIIRELDGPLYANAPFVDVVSTLARRSRHTSTRILVMESEAIMHQGHLLIELSQRLSSSIQIRKLGEEGRDFNQACLVADSTGVLHRPQSDLYAGTLDFNAPGQAQILTARFEELWEHSAPDPELRRLHV
ncbi:MAG: hypothetical protein U9R74_03945 [Pseudomonadota bacterium]|nr:hypothetical protein [Pseudomonadota bacterium]